ncbi:MAG: pyridoxamine 5'-phosphate oxidase family protein [Caldimonas sp.]|nr:pyridoxamine 5'-phosphate oxidase family protein [Pseudomonadota bacterium]
MNDTGDQRTHLWKLVKDIKFAMFTTRHGNGHLHARPMTTQNKDGIEADESLWFFMPKHGDPVDDLKADPIVNLVYADPSKDTYVSISGTAAMIEDQAKKDQLWSKLNAAWFPGGSTDPNLALVQVQIVHANYWDVKESKVVQLLTMAKAAVTGRPPTELGEHGVVRMR